MKINSRSKSSLFLMEIIIVIAFFSLSAAICMKVFASAKVKTDDARNLTNASFAAESLAEAFKAEKQDGTSMKALYPYASEYNDVFTVYFDSDWTQAEEYSGVYRATLKEHAEDGVTQAKITVYDENNKELFSLVTASVEKEAS